MFPNLRTFLIHLSKSIFFTFPVFFKKRPLLYNPNCEEVEYENKESLRFAVIKFLKSFAEEGISEIMKQEASFENKKM